MLDSIGVAVVSMAAAVEDSVEGAMLDEIVEADVDGPSVVGSTEDTIGADAVGAMAASVDAANGA